jgi:hypothetical protein
MFQEADQSYDPRSVQDGRIQPWRNWWPYESRNGDNGTTPVVAETSSEAPWIKWKFNNDCPWEKPWIDWPLSWSPKYCWYSVEHFVVQRI